MNRAEISSKVIKICKNKVYDDTLQIFEANDLTNDIGFDSLDIMDVVFDVEKAFGIDISTKESSRLKTVGDLVELVYSKI